MKWNNSFAVILTAVLVHLLVFWHTDSSAAPQSLNARQESLDPGAPRLQPAAGNL